PESLPIENRRQFNPKSMVPGKSLLELKRHPELGGLVGAFVLIYLAAHAVQSNWSYFTIEKFHWSEKTIGISLGVVGLLVALVQGVLVRFTHPKLGSEKSVYIGLSFYSFGLFLFAFATQGWMMFLFLIPYCMGGIAGPALQSIIASKVPNNEQGEIQGALTGIMSLTSIVGPPLMTGLFAYFTKPSTPFHFSGVSFLLGALLMLVSVIVTFRTLHKPQAVL
ncbi:MAG: MFS transporter, partial [Ferruginibacter sp.]